MSPRGLYEKYQVSKTNGSPVDPGADYIVLRLDTDIAARKAVLAYANAIYSENQVFAKDLMLRVAGYELDEDPSPTLAALIEKVQIGHMVIKGYSENGDLTFSITAEGEMYVENMMGSDD